MIKILVVDDDKNIRRLMKAVLESEFYDVLCAENGEEALSLMETHNIDLILLDIMMPKMDGYELTQVLRSVKNNLPILMMSAKQLSADRKKGFLVGIDDYMSKPVDEEELLLRIKALLRRSKIATKRKITLNSITLDYETLTISEKGRSQILPQKEFQLLYKLSSYPGKIFTRIQLMEEIWGLESDSGWETVTVHIGRLRKRLEDWPKIKVETIRGLGYRVVEGEVYEN